MSHPTEAATQEKGATEVASGPTWRTKSDAAYHLLREQIIDGRLAPGAALDQESLARTIGLSTTPVREALRRLEAEGLASQQAHSTLRIPALSRRELTDVYGLRMLLDPEAARLACRAADPAACESVRSELQASQPPSGGGLEPVSRLGVNRRFHRAVYARSGNDTMTSLLDGLWDRCDRYRLQLLRDEEAAAVADHQHHEMLDAFCSGEDDRLVELVREHLQGSYHRLLDLLEHPEATGA